MILVTGAMGFIGLQVAAELAAHDELVLGYNRTRLDDAQLAAALSSDRFTTQHLDVASPYSVARAIHGHRVDSIVHLAVPALGAMPPAEETLINVTGLVNLLEAANVAGVGRVSVASSLAVYAGLADGPFREDRDLPVSSPSATSAMKKAEEILALHMADRTGLDLVMLRIAVIYGPRYRTLANLVSRLVHQAVRGRLPEHLAGPWTSGQLPSGLDLCYVKDCAAAVGRIHTAERRQHRIYNVGAGRSVSVAEVVDAVARAVPDAVLPDESREPTGPPTPQPHMDISRACEEFGLVPQYSLDDGLREYASWLDQHEL